MARQVEGDEPIPASESAVDLISEHLKTGGITVNQKNGKLSMAGLLDPNETMRCTQGAGFSHSDLVYAA